MAKAKEPVDRLVKVRSKLPKELHDAVLAEGEAAVPALIAVLDNEDLARADGPGGGWGPIHAARLLGEMKATAAIEPMLRQLVASDFDEILHEVLLKTLIEFGAPVFAPAWEQYERADDESRESLRILLGGIGVRDERILGALLAELEVDPVAGAINLGKYGDPAAIAHLERVFDAQIPGDDGPGFEAGQTMIEIAETLETLGKPLEGERLARLGAVHDEREGDLRAHELAAQQQPVRRETPKVGRNEPCPCGSGKKYKKCHGA